MLICKINYYIVLNEDLGLDLRTHGLNDVWRDVLNWTIIKYV